jgi:gamma-glutamyltranspeptidase/glutathione hydrolase
MPDRRFSFLLLLLSAATPSAGSQAGETGGNDPRPWVVNGRRMMVATDCPHASRVGLEVLEGGGNAVDAAAAVSFALSVTRPQSTGLGGGGFMIIRLAKGGHTVALDYRESAPSSASATMYREKRSGAPAERYGFLAAGVPGVVAGQAEAVRQFGTWPLRQLVGPAATLAEQGFPADEHYVKATRSALKTYQAYPELIRTCRYVYRVHLREGHLPEIGELVVQPALGRLLKAIAKEGPEVFYLGPVAEAIERAMTAHGGRMTAADLTAYRVVRRKPLRGRYRDYELLVMPPPSGGVCLLEALNILERFDMPSLCRRDPNAAMHRLIESMKHAFADRARWMGDPDFVEVPVSRLIDKTYARDMAARIRPDAVSAPTAYGSVATLDDAGTSHFCVVDGQGNCVVATETINTSFGSLAAIEEWGLILNNEMDDFAALPGEPNAYGLIQGERNAVAPRKRPLSSMSPTVVLEDGELKMAVGASGGPRIITGVLNVVVNVLDRGQNPPEAVEALRVHHQWKPEAVFFDGPAPPALRAYLESTGHAVSDEPRGAAVQAIVRLEDGRLIGISDPRKGGRPAGRD